MADGGKVIIRIDGDSSGFDKSADSVSKKAKGMASTIGKVVGTGAVAMATGSVAVGKAAIQAYRDYEQLVGGVETLFKDSAPKLMQYAQQSYKTVQISANEYMETVTSFSASLLQSLGGDTEKAAEYADRAVIDMSDNANKIGTDMASIQWAYQGFAKQNYTMLDNLKLGYGGTKEEMARLIKDASQMTDIQNELGVSVDGTSMSFSNIVNAIHVVQSKLGILGTSAKEASTTLQGSCNMMKSSWKNLLTGMSDPTQDLDRLMNEFFTSVQTFGTNLMPRVSQVLVGLSATVERLLPVFVDAISKLAPELLPVIVSGMLTLAKSVAEQLPTFAQAIIDVLPELIQTITGALVELTPEMINAVVEMFSIIVSNIDEIAAPIIESVPEILKTVATAIVENAPIIIEALGELAITLVEMIPEIFSVFLESIEGIFEGIRFGLLSEEVKRQIEAVNEEVDKALEKTQEIVDSYQKMSETAEKRISDAESEAYANHALTDELYNLAGQTNLTAEQKQRMQQIVDTLNGSIDGLNLKLDYERGALNLTKEAVKNLIDQKLELAKVEAFNDLYVDYLKTQARAINDCKTNAEKANTKYREMNELRSKGKDVVEKIKESEEKWYGSTMIAALKYGGTLEDINAKYKNAEDAAVKYSDAAATSKASTWEAYEKMKTLAQTIGIEMPQGARDAAYSAEREMSNILTSIGKTTDEGGQKLDELGTKADDATKDRELNITVKVHGEEKLNNIKNVPHNATGTSYAKGGLSVVNELGRELIQDRSGAFRYVDSNGPALTLLNRGDKVFTAAQSRAMLRARSIRIPGFANGLNNALASKSAASVSIGITFPTEALAKNTAKGFAYFLKKNKSYIIDAIKSITIDARTEVQKTQDSFNKTVLNEEQFYLNEKARIESEEYEKEYQEKLKNAKSAEEIQKVKNERIEEEQKKAQDKYLELLKEAADREKELYEAHAKDIENIKKDIVDSFTESVENAFDSIEELSDARDDLVKRLSEADKYVNVKFMQGKETIFESAALPDLEPAYKELEQYNELLKKLKQRGNIHDDFFDHLQTLDRGEGIKYMTALLNANDADYNKYVKYYTALNEKAQETATSSYEQKAKRLKELLIAEFSKTPEEMYNIGENSAKEFGEGFMNNIRESMSQVYDRVQSSLNAFFMPAVNGGTTSNYYDNSQITINAGKDVSARDIVEELRNEKEYKQHREGLSYARN